MSKKKPTKLHLTDQFIKNVEAQNKRISYYDQHLIENNTLKKMGVKGLALRVTKAGSKSFVYRYWYDGKSKRYKIGNYPTISLSEAREKARVLVQKVNDGVDPLAEKKARKNKPEPKRFKELVERYKKQHLSTLRPSTQRTYGNRIDSELLPAFREMYVKNITRAVIIELLEEIAIDRKQPTHSNRVRAVLSSIFTFAIQRELAEYNPVQSVPKLGNEKSRDRVLSEKEIKEFWEGLKSIREPLRSAFKILLLTGQRKGETCRMKWKSIAGNVWTIPKEETKAHRKHFVPLPPLAIEIIKSLQNDSPYVFESRRNKGKHIKWLHGAINRVATQKKIRIFGYMI